MLATAVGTAEKGLGAVLLRAVCDDDLDADAAYGHVYTILQAGRGDVAAGVMANVLIKGAARIARRSDARRAALLAFLDDSYILYRVRDHRYKALYDCYIARASKAVSDERERAARVVQLRARVWMLRRRIAAQRIVRAFRAKRVQKIECAV